jgi:ribonuclease HII
VLALLPGSRRSEVRYIASGFFKAAALVQKALPQTRIVVPAVPSLYEEVQRIAAEAGMQDRCLIVKGQSHDVLAACDCTLIASGTATLEAALYKRPMVISYSMHPWSWRLMKRKQLQPWVGLPNILCGDFVVPELLQDAATPEALAQAALGWLRASQDSPATIEALVERFTALHHELRRDTAELAAHAIQKSLPPPLLEQGCLPWHPPGLVAGVDEAGRGPLAGPVVAAAVILDDLKPIAGLNDSKKLTANRREVLYDEIRAKALCFCIAQASVQEIDEINILKATLLAMRRAVMGLPQARAGAGGWQPAAADRCAGRGHRQGDSLVQAISAASILAKVTRDRWCERLDAQYPQYGFAGHKGYGTAAHLQALRAHGATAEHRRSFAPVAQVLQAGQVCGRHGAARAVRDRAVGVTSSLLMSQASLYV